MSLNPPLIRLYPVRHSSPTCAEKLRRDFDENPPDIILLEAPEDMLPALELLKLNGIVPPIAITAYEEGYSRLYPLADFGPEYFTIKWCIDNNVEIRFIDLPSCLYAEMLPEESDAVYERIAMAHGERSFEDYWERNFEQNDCINDYFSKTYLFGEALRGMSFVSPHTLLREKHMRYMIRKVNPERNIAVICGAFHASALKEPYVTEEYSPIEKSHSTKLTLTPYSYERLSASGGGMPYPAFYSIYMLCKNPVYSFICAFAEKLRGTGDHISSAQVLDTVTLAEGLAVFRGGKPTVSELQAAAGVVFGTSDVFEKVFHSVAIGSKCGSVPSGLPDSPLYADFEVQLTKLRLRDYFNSDEKNKLIINLLTGSTMDKRRGKFLSRLLTIGFPGVKIIQSELPRQKWEFTPTDGIKNYLLTLPGDSIKEAAILLCKSTGNETLRGLTLSLRQSLYCGFEPDVIPIMLKLRENFTYSELYEAITGLDSDVSWRIDDTINTVKCLITDMFRVLIPLLREELSKNPGAILNLSLLNVIARRCNDLCGLWDSFIKNRESLPASVRGALTALELRAGQIIEVTEIRAELAMRDTFTDWFGGLISNNGIELTSAFIESFNMLLDTLPDEQFSHYLVPLRRAFRNLTQASRKVLADTISPVGHTISTESFEGINWEDL